ncbi:sensor domain-containing protein [Kamptonema formosum]|uniref:sensor domain-containing protein n=1 Tax=Kamptonema formosum TaxID=331992 RepID=UPI0006942E76|nr:EAL domain-containing protein [Oscillatoria sp. PCC 10802]
MIERQMPDTKTDKFATPRPVQIFEPGLEEAFEDITRLAVGVCEAAIALICLEDGRRYWFKSQVTADVPEIACHASTCPRFDQLFDGGRNFLQARERADSAGNLLYLQVEPPPGESDLLFCAGYPLVTAKGEIAGTLWVMDRAPKQLGKAQAEALLALSRLAAAQLELRRNIADLSLNLTKIKRKEKIGRLAELSLEAAAGAVFWIGPDARILYGNEAGCRLLGYSREEILDLSVWDINPDLNPLAWTDHWLTVKQRGELTLECQHRHKDGQIKPVRLQVNYLEWEGQECQCAFVWDITNCGANPDMREPESACEALRASEALHRLTLSNVTEAVFITDDTGTFTFICPNAQQLFGYSVEEVRALGNISKLLGENLFERSLLETALAIENIERQVKNKAGKELTVLVNVKRFSIAGGTVLYSCRDITERRQAEDALYEERERFRLLVDSVKDYAIFMLDPVGRVVSWNAGAERITGYLSSEIIGQHFSRFYTSDEIQQEKPWKALRVAAIAGRLEEEGLRVRNDGSRFWADVAIAALRDQFGYLRGFSTVIRDTTERKRIQEQLWLAAFYDSLTGTPNRAWLTDRLWDAVEACQQRPDYRFAVLLVDLDRFKLVNDSLGHSIGDQLLVAFAHRLSTYLAPGNTVARLGGDEFAILLENIRDISDATGVAEQIHALLKSPFHLNGHEIFTTASIGIAFSERTAESPDGTSHPSLNYEWPQDLLRDADTAMYRAKALGRARYEVFNTGMHLRAVTRLQLETDLRRAIQDNLEFSILNCESSENPNCKIPESKLLLHYQPVVSLETGRIAGFEALVRWLNPTRGLVSPAEFIPIAEDTHLILPLGQWVLREACLQLRQWHEQFPSLSNITINVNLSSLQIAAPNLVEHIDNILLETGLDVSCLKLEITESALMENAAAATEVLEELRARNIHLCVDDFGTGYSSLSYLQKLPVSTLKIDRSFVSMLGADSDSSEIVRAIVMLAHQLKMDVVAEGVETEEQLLQLVSLECDCGQGYFFAKPLDRQAAEALLASNPQFSL